MSEGIQLRRIAAGTPVYDVNGAVIGPVDTIEATGIRVLGHSVPTEAIARVDDTGVYLQLASAVLTGGSRGTSGMVAGTTRIGEDGAEPLAVPLVEERLSIGTQRVQVGEVLIHKRVVEEQIMVPVTVRREEIEVIRRGPGEPRVESDDPSIIEVTYLPLRGEEPDITTRPVVKREVVITRELRAEERQVAATVRSTEVTVEGHYDEAYARLRPGFEAHFAERQGQIAQPGGVTYRARRFADAEPNYRAGFMAGMDERYTGREFEDIAAEVTPPSDAASHDRGLLARIRDEVGEGFARARALIKR